MRFLLALVVTLVLAHCTGDETLTGYGAAGRDWSLVEMDGKPFRFAATLRFPDKGRIEGAGPCNTFSAAQTAPYPWFETGTIAATRRACPELAAEARFFAALAAMTLAEIGPGTLILSNPDGGEMVFTASD